MKKRIKSALAVALLCSIPVAAMANEAAIGQADALIKAGKPAEAYALLDGLEAKYAGNPTYDYLLATAALLAGNPSRATFIYERMLAINPDLIGVRADMGRAYYQMGDLARAKLEFEAILALSNVPPDLRSAVENYMAAVEQQGKPSKLVFKGYAEAGYGRDSNPLASATSPTVCFLNPAACISIEKKADNYLTYALGGEVIYSFDESLAAYVGGDYRDRDYRFGDNADNYTIDARAGVQYTSGRYLVRAGLISGNYWLDSARTRESSGVNLDWRYLLDEKDQLTMNGLYMAYRYVPESFKVEDYDLTAATFGWTHVLAPTTVGVLNLTLGHEDATHGRASGDKNYWGMRGTLQHGFNAQWGGFVSAGQQWAKYGKTDALFESKREDRLSDVTLGLVWSLPERWSVRPLYTHTRNWSNEDLYKYKRHDYSMVLRKDF